MTDKRMSDGCPYGALVVPDLVQQGYAKLRKNSINPHARKLSFHDIKLITDPLLEALRAERELNTWQPIESAPKDGTVIEAMEIVELSDGTLFPEIETTRWAEWKRSDGSYAEEFVSQQHRIFDYWRHIGPIPAPPEQAKDATSGEGITRANSPPMLKATYDSGPGKLPAKDGA